MPVLVSLYSIRILDYTMYCVIAFPLFHFFSGSLWTQLALPRQRPRDQKANITSLTSSQHNLYSITYTYTHTYIKGSDALCSQRTIMLVCTLEPEFRVAFCKHIYIIAKYIPSEQTAIASALGPRSQRKSGFSGSPKI